MFYSYIYFYSFYFSDRNFRHVYPFEPYKDNSTNLILDFNYSEFW